MVRKRRDFRVNTRAATTEELQALATYFNNHYKNYPSKGRLTRRVEPYQDGLRFIQKGGGAQYLGVLVEGENFVMNADEDYTIPMALVKLNA